MELIIEKNGKFRLSRLFKDIYAYRDLLVILAWRDYKVRYAQSLLGVFWAFLQPIATIIVFSLVFGRVAKIDTGEVPYTIYAQSGMVAWAYFSFLLGQAGNSIISSQNMIKKIYFPRIIIPLSKAVVGLIDFMISLFILMILMIYYKFSPSSNIIYLPAFLLITILSGLGVGIWVSALTVRYRDFKHLLPFFIQFGLFITPIAYPASRIPEKFQLIYYLNPMAGVVEGFRWSIIGGNPPNILMLLSLIIVLVLFISSIFYFGKVEKVMADIV